MLEILQSRAERGEDVCEETVAVLQCSRLGLGQSFTFVFNTNLSYVRTSLIRLITYWFSECARHLKNS